MNKLLTFFLLVWFGSTSYAQIAYEQNYTAALKKSQAVKKPIFILLDPKGSTGVAFKGGLNEAETSHFFNTNFVNLRLISGEPDALRLASLYKITTSPSYIFINSGEKLIFKWSGAKVENEFFIDLGREVLSRLESGTTLFDFDRKYAIGEINRKSIKDYINLRIRVGITDNAYLIEKYTTYMTVAEFDEPGEILFIFKAGPIISGKAYRLLYNNNKLTTEIFSTLPLSQRIILNRRIGDNTLNDAIAKRNFQQASQSADFARNSHGNDYKAGDMRATWNMMLYYKAVEDTAGFFSSATRYYDTHYMTVSLDSVKRVNLKANGSGNSDGVDRTDDRLNDAAWEFYELGARNPLYLAKAMLWSKRSIELNPDPNYYDTLAHIFYRMGLYDEAVLNQNKAINITRLQPQSKNKVAGLKLELKKMKERRL